MRWDYSATARQHEAIKRESSVGCYSPMRACTGGCKRRRSIGQFEGESTVCIRCQRRSS